MSYKKSNYWTQCSWERSSYESDEDYRERMQDLNDYSEFSYDD
jgi:hypothetical protein